MRRDLQKKPIEMKMYEAYMFEAELGASDLDLTFVCRSLFISMGLFCRSLFICIRLFWQIVYEAEPVASYLDLRYAKCVKRDVCI